MNKAKKIFFIAGEPSGDLQGSLLIAELKSRCPQLECVGLGGPRMEAAGMKLSFDLTKESVLGATDVLLKYFKFRRIFEDALKEAEQIRPDAVVLIDYPGFNLRFAKRINRKFPVFYYISPQLWAWGKRRLSVVQKFIHHMLVFFPFEEELYKTSGVPVTWIGHPLIDQVKSTASREALRSEWFPESAGSAKIVTLFAGSRETEVKRILPDMLKTGTRLTKKMETPIHFLVSESSNIDVSVYDEILNREGKNLSLRRIRSRGYDLLYASDLALVASGTATLETAITETPFLILYKTAALTFALGRLLVQIPYIGLVNVVAGRKIVPEFIQHKINPEKIAEEARLLLTEECAKRRMVEDLKQIKEKLGISGAAERGAEQILKLL